MKGYMCNVKPGVVSEDRAEGGQDNAGYGMVNGSGCALSPLVLACVDGLGIKFEVISGCGVVSLTGDKFEGVVYLSIVVYIKFI
jgi:hypothetical protein